ncbi:MAG: hypothetical protein IJ680_00355 [Paludibacteraceae bacterium]|nr:hypothetical protein [Paludibacteraceae bacterium]
MVAYQVVVTIRTKVGKGEQIRMRHVLKIRLRAAHPFRLPTAAGYTAPDRLRHG